MASAREKVFSTVELLEGVLAYLPQVDIIVSKRVCRAFRDVFEGSSHLQSLAYPAAEDSELCGISRTMNMPSFTFLRDPQHFYLRPWLLDHAWMVVPNPVLFEQASIAKFVAIRNGRSGMRCRLDLRKVALESSCSKMFITNPPISRVIILETGKDIENISGITIGNIAALLDTPKIVTIDCGNVKYMEEDFWAKARAKGAYIENRQTVAQTPKVIRRIESLLDAKDVASLCMVNHIFFENLRPAKARRILLPYWDFKFAAVW